MLRVDVPFAFNACNKTLPAGAYYMDTNWAKGALAIQTSDHAKACFAPVITGYTGQHTGSTRVAFRKYGDLYFLRGLEYGGSGNRVQLPPAEGESELARTNAPREVMVAARGSR